MGPFTDATAAAANGVLKSASEVLSGSGKAGAAFIRSFSGVVRSAIHAVIQVGGDVGSGAKGAVLGVLQGTKAGGKEALETISATSGSVIKGTSDIAGDITNSGKRRSRRRHCWSERIQSGYERSGLRCGDGRAQSGWKARRPYNKCVVR